MKSSVIFCHSEKPSEESIHKTSAPASTKAGTRSAKSLVLIPAPTTYLLEESKSSSGFSL